MPKLSAVPAAKVVKLLLAGNSKTGKTGALVSLVAAGYKLFILDYDNLIGGLQERVLKVCPDKIDNVIVESFRDKIKTDEKKNATVLDGPPTAFTEGTKLLDNWKTADGDFGTPQTWGPSHILVLDSLTTFSNAAWNWACHLNPAAAASKGKDHLQIYKLAQDRLKEIIALLTADYFYANVIVISHIDYITPELGEIQGQMKGFPRTVGAKLSPEIPTYFPCYAQMDTISGKEPKRILRTTSTAMIDLGNPASLRMQGELPIETGLADFFATVLGKEKSE